MVALEIAAGSTDRAESTASFTEQTELPFFMLLLSSCYFRLQEMFYHL